MREVQLLYSLYNTVCMSLSIYLNQVILGEVQLFYTTESVRPCIRNKWFWGKCSYSIKQKLYVRALETSGFGGSVATLYNIVSTSVHQKQVVMDECSYSMQQVCTYVHQKRMVLGEVQLLYTSESVRSCIRNKLFWEVKLLYTTQSLRLGIRHSQVLGKSSYSIQHSMCVHALGISCSWKLSYPIKQRLYVRALETIGFGEVSLLYTTQSVCPFIRKRWFLGKFSYSIHQSLYVRALETSWFG